MLPKKNKLTSTLFRIFGSKGRVYTSEHLNLRFSDAKKDNYRVSVVVSKKVAKKAVKRNLLKRRVFSIVSENKKDLKEGGIYTFYLKKGSLDVDFNDLKKEVINLLRKA